MRYKALILFAIVNLLFVGVALIKPIALGGQVYGWPQAAALMLIQAVIALAMVYAATQKLARADIAAKAYPAVLMSYVLWLCMVWRWLAQ